MGVNNILTAAMFSGKSVIDLYPQFKGLATAINMFASAPFAFLPVLIGFSATKKFGGNPYLGAVYGYDHGSSRSVKCIQYWYRQSASMGYLDLRSRRSDIRELYFQY